MLTHFLVFLAACILEGPPWRLGPARDGPLGPLGSTARRRPNFLIVVADDLGFSDTSPYGGEMDTPNLQRLADEGVRMTGFHTAASCSPTRAMLLSGTDSHIAGLGCMAERMRRFPEIFEGRAGYEGYLNFRVAALPEILQDAGYFTLMTGKWHLGLTKETSPWARGFTRVLSTLPGAGNHFNREPVLRGLKEKPRRYFKGNGIWMRDGDFIDGSPEGGDLPRDFYSSNTFTDYFLDFLRGRNETEAARPFFGYLAFTAPHWPLQAPRETVEKYRGRYDDGPVALRDRRLRSLVSKGLVPPDVEPAPMHMLDTRPWDELSDDERNTSSRTMEVYAAMVDLVDVNVGRVLDYLDSTGELDDTFVVFMSDNGAEGQLLEAVPVLTNVTMGQLLERHYDNSLENIGNHDSFVWYGPQWAGAATAPSRAAKSYATEGGIRCPCIVRHPPSIPPAGRGAVAPQFTSVMDLLPTALELAGVAHPAPRFRGRDVVAPRGRSWLPLLRSSPPPPHQKEDHHPPPPVEVYGDDGRSDVVGWEQLGTAAVRLGGWKALFLPPPRGPGRWELYNVAEDPAESRDLAAEMPAKLAEMVAHYEAYFHESGMFDAYALYQQRVKEGAEGLKG
ncbi:hypothetical protein RB598_004497 [Gaeumannomyces tritici]